MSHCHCCLYGNRLVLPSHSDRSQERFNVADFSKCHFINSDISQKWVWCLLDYIRRCINIHSQFIIKGYCGFDRCLNSKYSKCIKSHCLNSYLIFGRNCQLNKVVSINFNCWKLSGWKNGTIQVQLQCLNSPKNFYFILCSILQCKRGFIAAFLPSRIIFYNSPKTLKYWVCCQVLIARIVGCGIPTWLPKIHLLKQLHEESDSHLRMAWVWWTAVEMGSLMQPEPIGDKEIVSSDYIKITKQWKYKYQKRWISKGFRNNIFFCYKSWLDHVTIFRICQVVVESKNAEWFLLFFCEFWKLQEVS